MDFHDAYLKLRSPTKRDVLDGIETMKRYADVDDFNQMEYIYNIAYGYYRLNDLTSFEKLYAENIYPFKKLDSLNRHIYMEQTKKHKITPEQTIFLPIAYFLLAISIGLGMIYPK